MLSQSLTYSFKLPLKGAKRDFKVDGLMSEMLLGEELHNEALQRRAVVRPQIV